jgi:hypothetical protein
MALISLVISKLVRFDKIRTQQLLMVFLYLGNARLPARRVELAGWRAWSAAMRCAYRALPASSAYSDILSLSYPSRLWHIRLASDGRRDAPSQQISAWATIAAIKEAETGAPRDEKANAARRASRAHFSTVMESSAVAYSCT